MKVPHAARSYRLRDPRLRGAANLGTVATLTVALGGIASLATGLLVNVVQAVLSFLLSLCELETWYGVLGAPFGS